MNELLRLPFEIQLLLVSGYLGYKLTNVARRFDNKTEDFLLQVLVFGSSGRIFSFLIMATIFGDDRLLSQTATENDYRTILAVCTSTIIGSLSVAIVWRKFLDKAIILVMSYLNIYQDDHATSVLRSITSANAKWSFIQVHLSSGKILEASFYIAKTSNVPTNPIIINDDGLALYVTAIHSEDGEKRESIDVTTASGDAVVTYVPISQIKQIDIGWRR